MNRGFGWLRSILKKVMRGLGFLCVAGALALYWAPAAEAIIVAGSSPDVAPWTNQTTANGTSLGGVAFFSDNNGSCSGAFFEPSLTYILTAAHCVQGFTSGYVQVPSGAAMTVASVTADPNYSSGNIQENDIAIVTLATPAPAGTPYYSLYAGSTPSSASITLAGFGDAGTGTLGNEANTVPADSYTAKTLRQGTNVYDFSSAQSGGVLGIDTAGTDLFYQFVGPGGAYNAFSLYNRSYGTHLTATNSSSSTEASIAPGDSGGPSFVSVNGVLEIAGVHSFTTCILTSCVDSSNNPTYQYGMIDADTDVSLFTNFIYTTAGLTLSPEPGTFGVLSMGLAAIAVYLRRRTSQA